ncbi:aminodeoxychorismate synthase component I [Emticicia aquatilis]|uniref:aminodeoxychorismate synthase component I n=1 Tax=Emticicia aquatilis TaxID=1537369 RepID=UPI001663D879|nr:aminodeoxychorismate synthase component I [Emticicia aquatilis]
MKLNRAESIEKINDLASNKIPFLMISDFEGEKSMIWPLDNVNPDKVKYWMNGISNHVISETQNSQITLQKFPISFEEYQQAFEFVKTNILLGNSFLTNLTCATKIDLNIDLQEVFERSEARYKVLLNDEFICFSPEIFVQINESGKISSFPMKGTIDANIPHAESIILSDKKEFYEHTTIVDLIRNDISKVANKVWVEKFRYIDKIQTSDKKELLQVSSQVSGLLTEDWKQKLGDIIFSLLPAGSISGAPKDKTLEIIAEAEKYTYFSQFGELCNKRGFYTGICGIFSGKTFDSGVMIRFIEKTGNGLVYKSGGGITAHSIVENEYQEMIQKIYVPIV